MVTRRPTRGEDPDVEAPEDPRVVPDSVQYNPSFILQTIMELQKTQGGLTEAIRLMTQAVERQTQQLGKIDDLRVGVGKLETKVEALGVGSVGECFTCETHAPRIASRIRQCATCAICIARFSPLRMG